MTQVVVTFTTAGAATWTAPPGVTSVLAECWGGGGGGGDHDGTSGAGGAGGGEYAAEPALAVTPGSVYNLTVGAAGTGSVTSGTAGGNGTASTFAGNSVTVTGNGGGGGKGGSGQTAAGGTGSTNTTHANGGGGAVGGGTTGGVGGGGGGSAAAAGAGNAGSAGATGVGGAGGAALAGGGPGGTGASTGGTSGNAPASGPGGGGGGGSGSAGSHGGNGFAGQVQITYTGAPVVLLNSFEGGSGGTTITTGNSGGASGTAWDVVNIVASGTVAYDSTHAAHGALSGKFATAATSGVSDVGWTTSLGSQTTVYWRAYVYVTTATPSPLFRLVQARVATTHAASVLIGSSGIQAAFGSGFTTEAAFTNPAPVNTWFRLEGAFTGSASGSITVSLYEPEDAVTPLETHTYSSINTGGPLSQYYFGQCNSAASSGPFWLDDVGFSTTGPLGPVVTAKPRYGSIVPSLIAAGAI